MSRDEATRGNSCPVRRLNKGRGWAETQARNVSLDKKMVVSTISRSLRYRWLRARVLLLAAVVVKMLLLLLRMMMMIAEVLLN